MSAKDANMQDILALKSNIPLDKDALKNVWRNKIMCSVSLPAGQIFLIWICAFVKSIENYGTRWRNPEMTNPSLRSSTESVFLQYYSLKLLAFWKAQKKTAKAQLTEKPTAIITKIEEVEEWVRVLSRTLRTLVKIDVLCRYVLSPKSMGGTSPTAGSTTPG